MDIIADLISFLAGLDREFAFLLALPFLVAAVAFAGHYLESWRKQRKQRSAAALQEPRRKLRFR